MYKQYEAVRKWLLEQKKSTRVMLLLLTAAVAFYMVILLWLIPEMMEAVPMDTKYWKVKIAASILFLLPVYAGLLWGAYRCSFLSVRTGTWEEFEKSRLFRRKGAENGQEKENRRRWRWFLLGFGLTFLWLMLYYYAYFPGSFDWDNLDQWWQIQNSQYDTWHPVFHTLIIALFSRIVNHYGFAVFMQLFLYSLLCGYLLVTMAKWRFPAWGLALTEFFLAANPQEYEIGRASCRERV